MQFELVVGLSQGVQRAGQPAARRRYCHNTCKLSTAYCHNSCSAISAMAAALISQRLQRYCHNAGKKLVKYLIYIVFLMGLVIDFII